MKRIRSNTPPIPACFRSFQIKLVIAYKFIDVPSVAKIPLESTSNPLVSAFHATASAFENPRMRAVVSAWSMETPSQRPSGKADANGCSVGTNSKPFFANSSAFSEWNDDPAKSDRFIAAQSWRKPGNVYSPVLTAPPGSEDCSKISTLHPRSAR